MCGIAAIFNYRTGEPIDRTELTAIRDAMTARGPDGSGTWCSADGHIGLGHRRLSIIDLSPTGAQPMKSQDGALVVTFNGEIYNYRELRAELEAKGRRFSSQSDTEILLHLYQLDGDGMLQKLRGMYAFAIWDERKKGLFMARDPFGIKPLYYSDDGKAIRVASQVKALLAGKRVDTAPDPAGHVGFFLWGHVPGPYTLHRGIRSLPAGTTLWVGQNGERRERTFCSITEILRSAEPSVGRSKIEDGRRAPHPGPLPRAERETLNSQPSTLNDSLRDSVAHHLIADVPVGVFLSSGLDSTTLAALAAEQGGRLRTVTLGFEEYRGTPYDETPLAETVAAQYGAQHQTIWVSRADFRAHVERLFHAMDQPSTDGVNTYFVSLAAAQTSLKVALSGLGGDELFGGYPSFKQLPRSVRALGSLGTSGIFGKSLRIVCAPVVKHFTSPKYAGLFEYGGTYGGAYLLRRGMFMPWELPEILDPDLVRQGWSELQPLLRLEESLDGLRSPHARVSCLESCWYMRNQLLRDSDWAGMAHSLEIRVPLVDVTLLRALAPSLTCAAPPTKLDLARTPRCPLPAAVLARPKTGFLIPVREWLLEEKEKAESRKQKWEIANRKSQIGNQQSAGRGLRGWAKEVYQRFAGPDLLVLGKRSRSLPINPQPQPRLLLSGSTLNSQPSPIPAPRSPSDGYRSPHSALPGSVSQRFSVSGFLPKRILVFRIGQLGDTIIALPAMWAVRKHFPDASLTLLCDRHPGKRHVLAADLLKRAGLFNRFESYVVDETTTGKLLRAQRMLRLMLKLRRRRFDALVYLAPSNRTPDQVARDRKFFAAAGIRDFIGTSGFSEAPAKTPDQPLAAMPSEADLLLARLAVDGIAVPQAGHGSLELKLGDAENCEVDDWLARQSAEHGGRRTEDEKHWAVGGSISSDLRSPVSDLRPWIGIGPGSKMPAKRWPEERFGQVVRELIERHDFWPVVFGGAEDAALAGRLLRMWGRGYNAAGALSVRGAAAALKRCVLFFGNDTGTMHLAAAVRTPCVAVFSARAHPGLWYPYGVEHRVLRSEIDCEGCGLMECLERRNECLSRIQTNDVVQACEDLMRREDRESEILPGEVAR
ncbi:MAG: asparagine synthase (glutamine-hydrolyzing) [Verrucomicrobia bacterium]|nr:asparagine synthase (glutamine-hydrolyzing) [Verrucomicrobiota bacterium]